MSSTDKFKLVLRNMNFEEALNFIWLYDQYVVEINNLREEQEDWDVVPLNIEDYYHDIYKFELA